MEDGGCLAYDPQSCGSPAIGRTGRSSTGCRLGSLCSESSATERGDARRDSRSIVGGWLVDNAFNFAIDLGCDVDGPALAGDGALDLSTVLIASSIFTNEPKVELTAEGLSWRCLLDRGVLGALSLPRFIEVRPSIGIIGGLSDPDFVCSISTFDTASSKMMSSNSGANFECSGGAVSGSKECCTSP